MTIRNKGRSLATFPQDFTVIDIETTGLDPQFNDIIELSAVKVRGGKAVDTYSSLVSITYGLDPFITDLTGITDKMLEDAPALDKVLTEYAAFLDGETIVGHNVNFDINFVYDKLLGFTAREFSNDFVDTMRLARFLLRDIGHHRLSDLANYYGLNTEIAHRGLADSEVTHSVLEKLKGTAIERYGSLDEFEQAFKARIASVGVKAKDITATTTDFDVTDPLYEMSVVFTGALEKMARKDAFQIVVNRGGKVQDGVTKDTNYLIIGSFDYSNAVKDGKSSKIRKAEALALKGQDIQVLSENVFYDMIGEDANAPTAPNRHKTSGYDIPITLLCESAEVAKIKSTEERDIHFNKKAGYWEVTLWDEDWEEHLIGYADPAHNDEMKVINDKHRRKYRIDISNSSQPRLVL